MSKLLMVINNVNDKLMYECVLNGDLENWENRVVIKDNQLIIDGETHLYDLSNKIITEEFDILDGNIDELIEIKLLTFDKAIKEVQRIHVRELQRLKKLSIPNGKVLYEVFNSFGKFEGEELIDSFYDFDDEETRLKVLKNYSWSLDDNDSDEMEQFVNGVIDDVYIILVGGDWDEPTNRSIEITKK